MGLPGSGKTTLTERLQKQFGSAVVTKWDLIAARGRRYGLHAQTAVRFLRLLALITQRCGIHASRQVFRGRRWRKLYYMSMLRQLYADGEKALTNGQTVVFDQGIVQELGFSFIGDRQTIETYAPLILDQLLDNLPITVVLVCAEGEDLVRRIQERERGKAFFDGWPRHDLEKMFRQYDEAIEGMVAICKARGWRVLQIDSQNDALADLLRPGRTLQEQLRSWGA